MNIMEYHQLISVEMLILTTCSNRENLLIKMGWEEGLKEREGGAAGSS